MNYYMKSGVASIIASICGVAVIAGYSFPWVGGEGIYFSGSNLASPSSMFGDESMFGFLFSGLSFPEISFVRIGGIVLLICSLIAFIVSMVLVKRNNNLDRAVRALGIISTIGAVVAMGGVVWFIVHSISDDIFDFSDFAFGLYVAGVAATLGLIFSIFIIKKQPAAQFVRQRATWDSWESIDTRREGNLCNQCGLESPPSAKFCPSCGIEFFGEEKLARARASELVGKLNEYTAVTCSCGTCFRVPPDHEGNSIKCPRCGKDNPINEVSCPECGSKNLPAAKFCCSCGAKVVRENKALCQNCGEVNPPNASFCTSCGNRLGQAQVVQEKQPEPAKPLNLDPTEFEGEITREILCPKCGSKTVIRTVMKGPNTGLKFHVCVRFPECKGRTPVEESLF